jgi:tRNA U34 5-methylaminomethyl-2-thiouridine-forming methyltransferase MnmC
VCFSGSVLLETFDIEVVSYDGNLLMLQLWIHEAKSAKNATSAPNGIAWY